MVFMTLKTFSATHHSFCTRLPTMHVLIIIKYHERVGILVCSTYIQYLYLHSSKPFFRWQNKFTRACFQKPWPTWRFNVDERRVREVLPLRRQRGVWVPLLRRPAVRRQPAEMRHAPERVQLWSHHRSDNIWSSEKGSAISTVAIAYPTARLHKNIL